MSAVVEMNVNVEFLNYILQNAEMGQNTINKLLGIIDDSKFKNMLNSQFKEYKEIFDQCKHILDRNGHEIERVNALQKFEAYMMINLKTLKEKSPDHISEMLIQGSTMGEIQILRRIRQYENHIDDEVFKLAEKLLKTERRNIEECKKFLC